MKKTFTLIAWFLLSVSLLILLAACGSRINALPTEPQPTSTNIPSQEMTDAPSSTATSPTFVNTQETLSANAASSNSEMDINTLVGYVKEYLDIDISPDDYYMEYEGHDQYDNDEVYFLFDKNDKKKMYYFTVHNENNKRELRSLYRIGIVLEPVNTTTDEKLTIAKNFLVQKGFVASESEIIHHELDAGSSAGGDKTGFYFEIPNRSLTVAINNIDGKVCFFFIFK